MNIILCTFQKFDCHCVRGVPFLCPGCYIPLGRYCSNIHGECTFVHLAIIPLSQFDSYFEVGVEQFPPITLGGQEPHQLCGKLSQEINHFM